MHVKQQTTTFASFEEPFQFSYPACLPFVPRAKAGKLLPRASASLQMENFISRGIFLLIENFFLVLNFLSADSLIRFNCRRCSKKNSGISADINSLQLPRATTTRRRNFAMSFWWETSKKREWKFLGDECLKNSKRAADEMKEIFLISVGIVQAAKGKMSLSRFLCHKSLWMLDEIFKVS